MNIHPACAAWLRPSDTVAQEMAASIKAEGLHNPIWLTREGEILDGKTRFEACALAGVEPRFQTYDGDDYAQFTIAQNKIRHQMTGGELALALAELSKLPRGTNRYTKIDVRARTSIDEAKTIDELAKAGEMSRENIVAAKTILQDGEPNVIEMVRKGEVGVRNAALYVKHTPRADQRQATAKTIKTKGAAFRTPNKVDAIDPSPGKTISIHVLIEELVPLFERVKVQSTKHVALISKVELGFIAAEGRRLIDRWASDDDSVRRMRGHVVPLRHPAIRKG
jgi:ParB-like chromosome segregation protein Spo0J